MGIIVSKFGGSSTANAHNLKCIARIVRASPNRRCVVLSAPGIDPEHTEKVTAMLDNCWDQRKSPAALERAVSAVARRFQEICAGLDIPDMTPLVRRALYNAVDISLPHTLSRGEYLCALVFSRYTGLPVLDAAELIAFDADGRLDEERTRRKLKRLAKLRTPVIVPGFYGADPRGRICILPRNGSDISGALIAAGMDADLFENWTDVPGLMTADPVLVPEARLIPHVGYRQMRAMSRAGAQVLHPACLDPVAMAGIPTRLRDTLHPESFGTLIDERCDRIAPCIVGRRSVRLPDGSPAAQITAFALSPEKVANSIKPLIPIDMKAHRDYTVIMVAPDAFEEALERLHRGLIEKKREVQR